MKPLQRHRLICTSRRGLVIETLLVLIGCVTAYAQISPTDPTLKMWLKADAITGSTLYQRNPDVLTVPSWTDSSTNGTVIAIVALPPADTANDPSNHIPQLLTFTNNGRVFQAAGFSQAFDPVTPDPTHGHLSDRLCQTNHLDATDPTLIDPTNDITLITVFLNNAVALGSYPCIVAKRGSAACPFEFGVNAAIPNFDFITYAGSTVYAVGNPFPTAAEWAIVEMNVTAGGVLTFRQYYRSQGGWASYSLTGVARGGFSVGDPFTLCAHVQGGTLPDNPFGGSGAYERFAGDIAEVALYNRSLGSNELQSVENYLLSKYFLNPGPPVIVSQPQSTNVAVFSPVSFSVLADGTPPFSYQWLKGGSPILGAPDSPSYSIASAAASDSGVYSVKVSNGLGFTNSFDAVLTVIVPTNKPTLLSALRDYTDTTNVTVTFSELVTVSTATNIANYGINNGVSVNGATAATNTNYVTTVVLTATPITTAPSILTVSGIQDRFGNTIVANSQIAIPIPGATGTPPSDNRVLWLAADTNVSADAIGVYQWDEVAGTAHSAGQAFGNVKLGQIACPNAVHPVLSFDGTCALQVVPTADFNLQTITIYLVGDLDATKTADDFIGNWEGFVLGGSDGKAGALKWSTWGTDAGYHPIDPSPVLGNRVPTLIVGSFANPGNLALALNTVQVAVVSNTVPISYATARGMTIGALFPTPTQNLFGDVAEVLIYSSVSAAQDTAVQNYLIKKYFTPSTTPPALVSATGTISLPDTNVTVVFSAAVTPATATNASNYGINHGVTVSAASVVNGTTVRLTTSAISPGTSYTLSADGVTDWAGNSPNNQITITLPGDVVRLQDSSDNHLLVLEAEDYSLNTPGSGQSWTFTTSPPFLLPSGANTTFSGSGCMVVPNNGGSYSFNPGDIPVGIPELDYRVYFTTSGTFSVWVRGAGDSDAAGGNDSISLGLDGAIAYRINGVFPQSAGYAWGQTATPAGATFTVPTPGYHVLNAWMREDGFGFDKLVLSSNPTLNPTGIGPAESVAVPTLSIVRSGGNLIFSWGGGGVLQSSTNVAGTYVDIVGSSSPWTNSPTGGQKFYRVRQ